MKRKTILTIIVEVLLILVFVSVDLLTKTFIYEPINAGAPDIVLINNILKFTAVQNTGASFGIFKGNAIILAIISLIIIIVVFIIQMFSLTKLKDKTFRFGLILIVAGGIGNIVDRFLLGHVRDFIYFELIDFPVFNIADSCLTIGCVLIIIYVIIYYVKDCKKNK
ncbi:MAG: signal peptidase II [Clostridiales bacterium]|jgi:signal peptidase II|nr:signal peptidase II [Clostridiales bacterium]